MSATRFAIAALVCAVLQACGGSAPETASIAPEAPASAPVCTPRQVSVALLGDSTMLGIVLDTGTVGAHAPGVQLQRDMDAEFGPSAVVVTDYGVGGTLAAQAPTVFADIKVVNYGLNDVGYGESVDTYSADIRALQPSLILTMLPWQGLDETVFLAAEKAIGVPVADAHAYVLGLPNWQQLIPSGMHPADEMYQLVVDNVLAPAVAKLVAALRCPL